MIIVLLLFFQSICLYCQRLVLYVYDRWINPKNTRILKEAAELTGNPKLLQQTSSEQKKRNRKRYTTSASGSTAASLLLSDSCRFCANTPQGYCRHHFHLQELEIQKQQRGWNPLGERESEYRQWRKANRELKRNLKNRLLLQQQQQEQTQQQFRRPRTQVVFNGEGVDIDEVTCSYEATITTLTPTSTNSMCMDSGYYSIDTHSTATSSVGSSAPDTPIESIYYFEASQSTLSTGNDGRLSGAFVQPSTVPEMLNCFYKHTSSDMTSDEENNARTASPRRSGPVTVRKSTSKKIIPLENATEDNWTWSKRYRSKEVVLSDPDLRTVHFHPNWSKGTAGVQGKRPLNNGRFYWELHVSQRVFGTSIMFGIGTKQARIHANSFRNMLGEDEHGWGLSHKGVLWHNGVALLYTKRFKENQATVIGILFDGIDGTLTYYKDGKCLGVAFRGLDKVKQPLYPIVCSTAAKTEMTLKCTRREFVSLQDRCRSEIMKNIKKRQDLAQLKLPSIITKYLSEAFNDTVPLRQVDNYDILVDF